MDVTTQAYDELHSKRGLHGVTANVGDLIPVGGGVPVIVDGAVAGAIGVSGATEEQDHQIATTAVAGLDL